MDSKHLLALFGLSVTGPALLAQEAKEPDVVVATNPGDVVPLEPESSLFATPKHPDRRPPDPEKSRPYASQPNRSLQQTKPVSLRKNSPLPIPGSPARNLPPLAENDETPPAAGEGTVATEAYPGLLDFVPHSLRGGGISFECIYTGETFTKARGGMSNSHPTNYRSNLDLVGILDTGKMEWWDNGRFFVYGQNLSGRPLSASDVGDVQLFSNLDSTISDTERPQFTTVAEYWYEHVGFEDRLRMKIGKQDANADFALTDLGGEFVHSSFGFPPMLPFPTFPSQALGIAFFYTASDTTTLGYGLYDGTLPSGPQGVRWGFDTMGHNGAISLYQLEWKPQLGPGGELPTTVRTGMWHHTDNDSWVEFDDVPDPRTYKNNYGHFTSVDQMLWKEAFGTDDTQGLSVFFQYGWAPSNRNMLNHYYGGGCVYKGLVPDRDDDLFGLGFARAEFSNRFRAASALQGDNISLSETAIEMFYKAMVRDYMSIQPDLQYVANPGGMHKDALLPGLRFEVVF